MAFTQNQALQNFQSGKWTASQYNVWAAAFSQGNINFDPTNVPTQNSQSNIQSNTQSNTQSNASGTPSSSNTPTSNSNNIPDSIYSYAQNMISSGNSDFTINNGAWHFTKGVNGQILLNGQPASSPSNPVSASVPSLNAITEQDNTNIGTGNTSFTPKGTIQNGSTGADVTALQNFLNSQGANLQVDGKYGPLTQAAVKQYQSTNGLQADGIVGPQTTAKINGTAQSGGGSTITTKAPDDPSNQFNTSTGQPNPNYNGGTTSTQPSPLPTTGNTANDSAMTEMMNAIITMAQTGKIPLGLQLTPSNLAQILQIAQTATSPATQQAIQNEIANINQNIQNSGNQFSLNEAQTIQKFGTDLLTEQNNAGANGTAFSGQRALTENLMANSTNRTLASLSSSAQTDIGNQLRAGGQSVGSQYTNQFNLPNLSNQSVTLGNSPYGYVGGQGQQSSGLNYNYNPSLYTIGDLSSQGIVNSQNQANKWQADYNNLAANQGTVNTQSKNSLLGTIPGLSGNIFS